MALYLPLYFPILKKGFKRHITAFKKSWYYTLLYMMIILILFSSIFRYFYYWNILLNVGNSKKHSNIIWIAYFMKKVFLTLWDGCLKIIYLRKYQKIGNSWIKDTRTIYFPSNYYSIPFGRQIWIFRYVYFY